MTSYFVVEALFFICFKNILNCTLEYFYGSSLKDLSDNSNICVILMLAYMYCLFTSFEFFPVLCVMSDFLIEFWTFGGML